MENRSKILLAITIFIVMLPDLPRIGMSFFYTTIPNNWDSANISFWGFLIAQGKIPMLDFWYPYFGQYLFNLQFPIGQLFSLLNVYLILLFLLYGVAKITKGYVGVLLVLFILILAKANLIPAFERYLWGVDCIIVYIGINRGVKTDYIGKIIFNLLMIILFIVEPSLLIYLLPVLVILILIEKIIYKNLPFAGYISDFYFIPTILFFLIIINIINPHFFNAFSENFKFISLGSSYGSYPINKFNLYTYISTLFLMIGFYFITIEKIIQIGRVIIGISIYIIIILATKDSLRPIGRQLDSMMIFLSIFILFNLHLNTENKVFSNFAIGVFISWSLIFTAPYMRNNGVLNFYDALKGNFSLLKDEDQIEIYRSKQYSIERLSSYESIIDLYKNLLKNGINNDFYVYGDMPSLYLISDSKYPFIQNLYNSSPFAAQEKIVKWLISSDIKYIVIDRSQLSWDGVQNVVRTSIIYNFINNNYSYYYSFKNYSIFKKTDLPNFDSQESVKIFSNEVNLGKIFNGLYNSIYQNKCSKKDKCNLLLNLVLNNHSSDISLNIEYLGGNYIVKIRPEFDEQNYLIPLDSLWFINKNNLSFKINSPNVTSYEVINLNMSK